VLDVELMDRLRRHARREAERIASKAVINYIESIISYAHGWANRLARGLGTFIEVETRHEYEGLEGRIEIIVRYSPRHLVALENKLYEELVKKGEIPRLSWKQWLLITAEHLKKLEEEGVVGGAGGGEDTTTRQGGAEA
jgi:hypothetical protein